MRQTLALAVLAAVTVAMPAAARAQVLYSVDWESDELVAIDPDTGTVRVVGPLGLDAYDVDLAMHDGRLYAIDSHYWDRVDLLEIDRQTGAARVIAPLVSDFGLVPHAEGLTALGGVLYVGYSSILFSPYTPNLGTLALDGTVTRIFDFQPGNRDADLDGLGTSLDGALLGSDNKPGFGVYLNRVVPSPAAFETIGTVYYGKDACCGRGDDLDFVGLRLYFGNGADGTIAQVDPRDGSLIRSIPLSRAPSGGYSGLANGPLAAETCEPHSIGFWRHACGPKDKSGEGARLAGYADEIRRWPPFSMLGGRADLCARLDAGGRDKCAQAEAQLLALLLNVASSRLDRGCCIAEDGPSVTEALDAIRALLRDPARTRKDCVTALSRADALNSGASLCKHPPMPCR